jgi:glutathione synthase/RimK-type ligase-like ATP-grasp enzyme
MIAWPTNSAASVALARDKAFCAETLSRDGLDVVPTKVVFTSKRYADVRAPGHEPENALAIATALGWPLVVKPNQGARGCYVKLCANEDELNAHIAAMAPRYDVAILQPFVTGKEYRVFVMDDSAIFAYAKKTGRLEADGQRSVAEIIHEYSTILHRNGLDGPDLNNPGLVERLNKADYKADDIPPEGFVLEDSIQANIAYGADIHDFTTDVPPVLAEIARRAAKSCNLEVAGVDMICPHECTDQPQILEVNANPGISSLEKLGHQELARYLFRQAIARALGL